MKIKERFTTYVSYGEEYPPKETRVVFDHLQNKSISEIEAERICFSEYGEHFNARTKVIRKTAELISAEMELYNSTCEKGFEITIKDIENKLKEK